MSIIGVLLSFVVLIYLIVKRDWSMLTATIPASLIIILFDRMNIWDALANIYSPGVGSGVQSYFLLLSIGALFGNFMAQSGCALKIAHILIKLLGRDRLGVTMYFLSMLLVYGGISILVVVFTVGPIGLVMCKETNLPRRYLYGAIFAGGGGAAMTSIPGTPSLTNLIPTGYLGTTAMSAPVLGIISTVIQAILCLVFLNLFEKRYRAKGLNFEEVAEVPVMSMEDFPEQGLPSGLVAFIPIIIQVGFILFLSNFVGGSTAAAVFGSTIACAFIYIVNRKRFKENLGLSIVHGAQGGITAAINLGAIVAFGVVVKASEAYTIIVEFCYTLTATGNMVTTLFALFVAVSIFVAVCASAAGGLEIFWAQMGPDFIATGINPQILHRISSIAAGGFDSVPHNSAYATFCTVLGVKLGEGYPPCIIYTLIIPIVANAICIFLASLGVC